MIKKLPKRIFLIIILLLVTVLAVPAYGYVARPYIIPIYTNTFYKNSADQAFNSSFIQINQELNDLGFNVSHRTATCHNGVSDSGDAWYHFFGETLECSTTLDSSRPIVNSVFRQKWDIKASTINFQLKKNGWNSDNSGYGSHSNLSELYDNFNPLYTNEIYYSKSFGKFMCTIQFNHGPSATTENSDAYVSESCMRYVSFFGGYID